MAIKATNVRTLDLRQISHAAGERRDKILATWQDLPVGETLRIINDHDPVPLRHLFRAEYADQFEWAYEQEGPADWIVQITKTGT
jgi:uncharacterized protein (DUF2249 family)